MYRNRFDAADHLAEALEKYKSQKDTMILAIPRGSLQMGLVLSKKLKLPLDIVVAKKIGVPPSEEYAIGAVGPEGEFILDEAEAKNYGLTGEVLEEIIEEKVEEINRRYNFYREGKGMPDVTGKTLIIIDDGIATGMTMRASVKYLQTQNPKKIVIAVPVAASSSLGELKHEVDEIICLDKPVLFMAVGQFYYSFDQVSDEQAAAFLKEAWDFYEQNK